MTTMMHVIGAVSEFIGVISKLLPADYAARNRQTRRTLSLGMKDRCTIQSLLFSLLISACCQENNPTMPSNADDFPAIVYNKQVENRWQIILNSIAGNHEKSISNDSSDDAYGPVWSPDGKYIAFRSDREESGGSDIYLHNVQNGTNINLTSEFMSAESASPILWSPDSKKLLYRYHRVGEPFYSFVMDCDGRNKQKLFEMESTEIIDFFAPHSSILYTKSHILYKADIEANSIDYAIDLREDEGYLTWVDDYDPVSNTLLAHDDSSSWNGGHTFLIKRIDLNTMIPDTLVLAETGTTLLRPVFSNDYSKIAFIERDYLNGVSRLVLLDHKDKVQLNTITQEGHSYDIHKIQFSPRDSYITYAINISTSSDGVSWNSYIYALEVGSGKVALIDEGKNPMWNPQIQY